MNLEQALVELESTVALARTYVTSAAVPSHQPTREALEQQLERNLAEACKTFMDALKVADIGGTETVFLVEDAYVDPDYDPFAEPKLFSTREIKEFRAEVDRKLGHQ